MNKNFHIVCEGQTDFEIFKKIIAKVGAGQGKKYVPKVLFPPTSKNIGGWPSLKKWCKDRASELAGNQNRILQAAQLLGGKPAAFAGKQPVDKIAAALALKKNQSNNFKSIIVIQIDSDIAEDLINDASLPHKFTYPLSPSDRLLICENAIDKWLGGHLVKKGISIIYCISSLAIENWVLTLHSIQEISTASQITLPNDHDSIHSPDERLVRLGYKKESDGSLAKRPSSYITYGEKMANNLLMCCTRSNRLSDFCNTLIAI